MVQRIYSLFYLLNPVAPGKSGESDMAFQGFDELNCLLHSSPSPANYALSPPPPLSDSMVAYSRSNQSMDNPLQNQQWHDEDIVHLPPYLAGDSELLQQQQQQVLQNWKDASDLRPREGIMTMNMLELQSNNQGIFGTPAAPPISRTKSYSGISQRFNRESESDEAIEYYEKLTCYNFPPSTSYFPLSQLPSFSTSSNSMAVCLWCNQSIENLPQNEQYKGIGGDPSLSFKEQLRAILSATEEVVRIRMVFREMSSTRKEKTPGGKTTTTTRVAGFEIMRANQPSHFPHRINPPVFNCPEVLENMKTAEHTAAMSAIRKDYLNLRRHAISIQAVYRGFQVQKYYRRMRWAVGVLEKGLLRWRRSADSMDANLLADLTMENLPQNQQHHGIVDPLLFVMEEDEVGTVGNAGEGTGVDEMEEDEVEVAVGIEGEEGTGEGEKSPRGESGNKKTTGVTTGILLEESLQAKRMTKGMRLEDAATNLNVSRSTLNHNLISQSRPNATPTGVDQVGISQLNFDTLPYEQGLAVTAGTSSFVVKEIPKPRARPDEDLGNHAVEEVGMVGEETGEGEMEEDQLNSGRLEKGKRKGKIPREERGSKKRNGVRIGISLEDILQNEGMSLKDAANNLNVSRSTLERSCREYKIHRWPPRKKNKIISHSCPNESPTFVDQERSTQLNSDALPTSNQVLANAETTSVTVKARYGNDTIIKFRLSRPWGMVELEEQVKKRLAGTFDIKYKDEDNEWILIACDEDLQDCISSSRPQGPTSIEVLLVPK